MAGTLSAFTGLGVYGYPIPERSEATPGLFNQIFSGLSANLDRLNSDVSNIVGSSVGTTESILGFSSNTLRTESGNTISVLPYSSGVILKSFDSGGEVYNVRAFGATGNGVTDDTVAIQNAIAAANFAAGSARSGSVVYFPAGNYVYTKTLQVPVITAGSITLRGAGMRSTYLFPSGLSSNFSLNSDNDRVCLVFGALTPDLENVFTNQTQYCGMEDMSQSGSILTDGSYVAHQITEMQYGWMKNCIIEAFPNASIGLYLRGATMTSPIGTETGPHVRLCNFNNCLISTIGSNNSIPVGMLLANADENAFFSCSVALTTGLGMASADSAYAVWVQSGRNNRWYGCLEQGDTSSKKTGYVGWVLGPPSNRTGGTKGVVVMNQMYGDVLEGFDISVWFQKDATNNVRGNIAYGINPSIVNSNYSDANAAGSLLGNGVFAPLLTPPLNYYDGIVSPAGGTAVLPTLAFGSELSLGWYRSAASVMALSYGQLASTDGSQLAPAYTFISNKSTGFLNNAGPGVDVVVANSVAGRALVNQWATVSGSAIAPSKTFTSETSLGLYRSANSVMAQSYGTLDLTAAVLSISSLNVKSGANNSCGTAVLGSNGSVNVANTYVKTGDLIFLTDQTPGGTLGDLEIGGIRNSSGFTIVSTSVTDTSTVAWLIVRPG